MIRLIQLLLNLGIVGTISAILVIVGGYLFFKPTLPEIELVDENSLISPVQIFSSDNVLLAEFGEQKKEEHSHLRKYQITSNMPFWQQKMTPFLSMKALDCYLLQELYFKLFNREK